MAPCRSVFRSDLFAGKVALVTGGGTGIGLVIATELAHGGATVVIASRDEASCSQAASAINEGLPANCLGKAAPGPSTSIRTEDEVQELVAHVLEAHGSLDLLVNNAGGQFVCGAEEMSTGGVHGCRRDQPERHLYGLP